MFHDLVHFTQLACTDYVAPGSEDYSKLDGNGNVFCGFDTFAATGKARTAKDGEWADFTGSTTITVSCVRGGEKEGGAGGREGDKCECFLLECVREGFVGRCIQSESALRSRECHRALVFIGGGYPNVFVSCEVRGCVN